jgi:hypothetical protein
MRRGEDSERSFPAVCLFIFAITDEVSDAEKELTRTAMGGLR